MAAEKTTPEDRESQLDDVIASYLEAIEAGETPDRPSWLQRYPHLADELAAFFADEARFDGLMAPLKAATPTPRSALVPTDTLRLRSAGNGFAPPPAAPERGFGDYEILREAARGGMGVVYKARQRSLNRVVALKMIRDGEWATPQDVHRFRLEAEAVAQLDHPNIVPVYEVGEWRAAGTGAPVHYFSMKWIDGGTLADLLASGRWSAAGKEGQRAAARLIAQAARAVHYAHQRGILHRDLKPANILLGGGGQTPGNGRPGPGDGTDRLGGDGSALLPGPGSLFPLITDFGLAKRLSADEPLTQTGVAVGTPSYMAPEQASPAPGRAGRGGAGLTMAADVYSLGAILYELLTGRPPFRGETMLDTLRELLEREPERPRAFNPRLDRDLETICLKCLQKDPGRRYPSAEAFAEDLERFLAGEPIQARPVGAPERVWRWCRRNPALAATSLLAALALPAALALLGLIAVNESRHSALLKEEALKYRLKHDEAQGHLRDAERQRAEAEKQRLAAVKHSNEADRQREREEQSFRQAHRAVNDFYTRLAGDLQTKSGLQPLQKKLLEAALGYYRNFLNQRKDDPRLKRELADAQFSVAHISSEVGSRVEAAAAYSKALAIYEELLRDKPGNVTLRIKAADACYGLARMLSVTGRPKEALAQHGRAREYYQALLRDHPNHPGALAGLSDIHGALGAMHRQAGRLAEAYEATREAVAIREKLARDDPRDSRRQGALALYYNNLGVIESHLGRQDAALKSYEKAKLIRERLVRKDPRGSRPRMGLAASYRDIGLTYRLKGDPKKAMEFLQKAREMRAQVAQENPRLMQAQTDLASSHLDVGGMLREAAARKTGPERKKMISEALVCLEQARKLQEKLVGIDPVSPYLRSDLANTLFFIGNLHEGTGSPGKALQAFAKARALLTKLAADVPDTPLYASRLGGVLNNMGLALLPLKRFDEARRLLNEALEYQRKAIARAPQVGSYRRTLSKHYGTLTEIELAAGRPAEAVAAARERAELWPMDPQVQYLVGVDLAGAAALVGKGKERLSPEEEAERTGYADLAMAALRRAVAVGFRDRQRLEQNPALAPLREREDFRQLLDRLGK
jgi:eukaryotic-like serine/threonine-protein kinase